MVKRARLKISSLSEYAGSNPVPRITGFDMKKEGFMKGNLGVLYSNPLSRINHFSNPFSRINHFSQEQAYPQKSLYQN